MKAIGTIKQLFPVNAFTPVIFLNKEGNYYTQIIDNGIIQGFESIDINKDELIETESMVAVRKGGFAIYCYTRECNSIWIGTLYSLKDKMYELINGDSINTVAKAIITSKYKIHNRTADYIKLSNKLFKQDNLNCKLSIRNYINVIEYDDKNLEAFYDAFSEIRSLIAKKNNIEWDDFIDITETKFYVNNFKIEIDLLFTKTNSKYDEVGIRQRLFDTIVHRVDNKKLNKNVFTNNKNFFPYLLSTPKRLSVLDKIAFTIEVPNEIKYKSESDFEKYGDKIEEKEGIDDEKLKEILKQAEYIKKAFQNDERKYII